MASLMASRYQGLSTAAGKTGEVASPGDKPKVEALILSETDNLWWRCQYPGQKTLSIPVFPQLWDTYLLFKEYSQNPSHVPDFCPSSDAETIDSSPRRLSFDWRQNYWLEYQLTRVPDVCTSTDAETINSSSSCLSFDRRINYWLTYQLSVLRPSQSLITHVPDGCPPTVTETKISPFVSTVPN